MVTTLIHSTLLAGVESCLNQLLKLDPAARSRLEGISGKSLRVACEFPPFNATLLVSDDRILLSQESESPADVTVSGRAGALLKLLVKKDTASLHDDGVVITGNAGLLSKMQEILLGMEIDWEYQLSRFIGDIPTQAVSDGVAMTQAFVGDAGKNLQQDLDDYLHVEKKLFPSEEELAAFYESVDELRLRVDRLDSRISRIQSRLAV